MLSFYSCLKHPEIEQNKQGTCLKCGMRLKAIKKEGKKEDDHSSHNL
jgi:hypothetical protein